MSAGVEAAQAAGADGGRTAVGITARQALPNRTA